MEQECRGSGEIIGLFETFVSQGENIEDGLAKPWLLRAGSTLLVLVCLIFLVLQTDVSDAVGWALCNRALWIGYDFICIRLSALDGLLPNAVSTILKCKDISENAKQKILADNVKKFYRW